MPTETRDNRGRFLPGVVNQAPGRPRRNPEVRLRSVFDEVLTRDELREIVRAHIDRGKAGSVASARLILEYAIGKVCFRKEGRTFHHVYRSDLSSP